MLGVGCWIFLIGKHRANNKPRLPGGALRSWHTPRRVWRESEEPLAENVGAQALDPDHVTVGCWVLDYPIGKVNHTAIRAYGEVHHRRIIHHVEY